ncbi:MAG: hypothetical protein EBS65_23505, partial [Betaproteobacteria bacterium]|nr:hypothetical protein [Betaproteobacteria bacterium]
MAGWQPLPLHRVQQHRGGHLRSGARSRDGRARRGDPLKPFAYHRPASVEEAAEVLSQNGENRILAGGMTLLPSLKHRLAAPPALVDLAGIGPLRGISKSP